MTQSIDQMCIAENVASQWSISADAEFKKIRRIIISREFGLANNGIQFAPVHVMENSARIAFN
jgi:hypothetical protein